MLSKVFATHDDLGLPVARLALAVVLWPHGAQKLLGWFGGYGWAGTMGYFTDTIGVPTPLAAGLILLEFFGPIFLLFGFLTRPVALGVIGLMLGAITTVHAQHGFFMNWFGAQQGEGFEYHLLVIGLAAVLALRGGGSFALDRKFVGR
ncbi:MAG: DoxX family protein [Planctomycetes bacterium]|nr:DoxX family protein [Planctomycetota bacterium]